MDTTTQTTAPTTTAMSEADMNAMIVVMRDGPALGRVQHDELKTALRALEVKGFVITKPDPKAAKASIFSMTPGQPSQTSDETRHANPTAAVPIPQAQNMQNPVPQQGAYQGQMNPAQNAAATSIFQPVQPAVVKP